MVALSSFLAEEAKRPNVPVDLTWAFLPFSLPLSSLVSRLSLPPPSKILSVYVCFNIRCQDYIPAKKYWKMHVKYARS